MMVQIKALKEITTIKVITINYHINTSLFTSIDSKMTTLSSTKLQIEFN